MSTFTTDIAVIQGIAAVPTILNVVCQTTGMGFAAVARVTEDRWIACSVLDQINFGLKPGGELKVETTICHEIRQSRQPVIIDHVAADEIYRDHHTPRQYGFQSYISMPIFLPSGEFFGTLCAIDPKPAQVNTPQVIGMFKLFAELIAFHIDAAEKMAATETKLDSERQISELREQFIGVLGHDLRNPLVAISLATNLLSESGLDSTQTATLEMMKRSVSKISDLIDDALDFTRGRLGGGISLDSQSELPVEHVLAQVIEEVRIRWPDRLIETDFSLLETIHYDRKRITQVFTNLLSNSMTHGKPGYAVRVSAKSANGTFEFSVSNAADPIPASVLERLFEPFSRGGTSKPQQGLGLGLYIASEIAKSHGGTLTAISTADEVRFTFAMPTDGGVTEDKSGPKQEPTTTYQSASSAEAAEASGELRIASVSSLSDSRRRTVGTSKAGHRSPESEGKVPARVLLIEDHPDTLTVLTQLLTRRGHIVTPTATGAHARAEFARGTFDLIVSDLSLPDCSGLDLISELCRTRAVPAIALSGYGTECDVQRSQAVGFSEHLTKPVDFEHLLQTVNRLAHKQV